MVQMTSNGPIFGIPPDGSLGEVKMFALTVTGAVTKAALQARGWAICDGTTPATQGVTSPTITAATPNLQNKFIRGSDNEASGSTGGAETHDHTGTIAGTQAHVFAESYTGTPVSPATNTHTHPIESDSSLPSYYELVFFIKVRM